MVILKKILSVILIVTMVFLPTRGYADGEVQQMVITNQFFGANGTPTSSGVVFDGLGNWNLTIDNDLEEGDITVGSTDGVSFDDGGVNTGILTFVSTSSDDSTDVEGSTGTEGYGFSKINLDHEGDVAFLGDVVADNFNFGADGNLAFDDGVTVTAKDGITTSNDGEGTLSFLGDGTINGKVGTEDAYLGVVNVPLGGYQVDLKGDVYTDVLSFSNISNDSTVSFYGDAYIGQGGEGQGITSANDDNGIIDFHGNATIRGDVGSDEAALFQINLKDAWKTLKLQEDVFADSDIFEAGEASTFINFESNDQTVEVANGKNITAYVVVTSLGSDATLTFLGSSVFQGTIGVIEDDGYGVPKLINLNGGVGTSVSFNGDGNIYADTVNFGSDGEAVVGDNKIIYADITTSTDGQGTLSFAGDGTIDGQVGADDAFLNTINVVQDGYTADFNGFVYVNTLALDDEGEDSALVNFNDKAFIGQGEEGEGITTGTDGYGIVHFYGDATVNGNIGNGDNALDEVDVAEDAGDTVTVNGDVYANDVYVGAGIFQMNGDLTTPIEVTLIYNQDGEVRLGDGNTISSNIATDTDNQGTLTFEGSGTVNGSIGYSGEGYLALKAVTLDGDEDSLVTINGDLVTYDITVGDGTLQMNGDLTSPSDDTLRFSGDGTVSLGEEGDSYNINTEIVTDYDGEGSLRFNGSGTVTGQVGGTNAFLNTITALESGSEVEFNNDVYVNNFVFGTDDGDPYVYFDSDAYIGQGEEGQGISTVGDGDGVVEFQGDAIVKGNVGAEGLALNSIDVYNSGTVDLRGDVYVRGIYLDNNSEVKIGGALNMSWEDDGDAYYGDVWTDGGVGTLTLQGGGEIGDIGDEGSLTTLTINGAADSTVSIHGTINAENLNVNGGTLDMVYSDDTEKLNSLSYLNFGGGTLSFSGSTGLSLDDEDDPVIEGVDYAWLARGYSSVTSSFGEDDPGVILSLNYLDREDNATIDFGADDIASLAYLSTSQTEDSADSFVSDNNGILGAWATVGGSAWATVTGDTDDNGNYLISSYANIAYEDGGYRDIADSSSSINDMGDEEDNGNVRINSTGEDESSLITLSTDEGGYATVNTLLQSNTDRDAVVDVASDEVLRTNGIMIGVGAAGLTIGLEAGDGILTSAYNEYNAGELILINNSEDGALTVNSVIADDDYDDEVTSVIISGTGVVTLNGENEYTGDTIVNAGTLNLNQSLTSSDLYFGGNGTVNLAVDMGISGVVYAYDESLGTLTLLGGEQTVGDYVGWDGDNNYAINTINAGADSESVSTFAENVYVTNLNIGAGFVEVVDDSGNNSLITTATFTGDGELQLDEYAEIGDVRAVTDGDGTLTFLSNSEVTGDVGTSLKSIGTINANGNGTTLDLQGDVHADTLNFGNNGEVEIDGIATLGSVTTSGSEGPMGRLQFYGSASTGNIGGATVEGEEEDPDTYYGLSRVDVYGGVASTVTVNGDLYADEVYVGAGTLAMNGDLYDPNEDGAVYFEDDGEIIVGDEGGIYTDIVTQTNNTGTLTFSGNATIEGNVGDYNDDYNENAIQDVVLNGVVGTTVTINGDVYAYDMYVGAGTLELNGSFYAPSEEDPETLIFTADGTVKLASGETIEHDIKTQIDGQGTLEFDGDGTVDQQIGEQDLYLKVINVTQDGNEVDLQAAVYVNKLVFGEDPGEGSGTDVYFDGDAYIGQGAAGQGITTAWDGNGSVYFYADATINGNIGANGLALNDIYFAGDEGETATVNGNLFAYDIYVGAGTLTMNGNLTSPSEATLTFQGNGKVILADGKTIDTDVITQNNNQGTLEFEGDGTVNGNIGEGEGNAVNEVSVTGNTGTTVTINGDVYAYDVYVGDGKLQMNGDLTTPDDDTITFTGDGELSLADGYDIVSNITTYHDGKGTLTLEGTHTIDGSIGSDPSDGGEALRAVNLTGASGSTVTMTGNLYADILDLGMATLDLDGSYAQDTLSAPQIKIAVDGTASGQVVVANPVVVTYGSVDINVAGYVKDGTEFTVVDGDSENSGVSVPDTITDNSLVLTFAGTNTGNDLILTATRTNSYTSIAGSGNTGAAGAALEAAGLAGATGDMLTILNILDGFATQEEVLAALETVSANMDGGVLTGMFTMVDRVGGIYTIHMDSMRSGISTGETGASFGDQDNPKTFWMKAMANYMKQGVRDGFDGYDSTTGGTMAGIDWKATENLRVGWGGGWANTNINNKVDVGGTTADSYMGVLYGSYQPETVPYYVDGVLTVALNNYEGRREVIVGPIRRQARADYDGQQYTGLVSGGYNFNMKGGVVLTPLWSLQYSHLDLEKYEETGAGALNLSVDAQKYDIFQSGLGLKLARPVTIKSGTLVPEIHAKWLREYVGDKMQSTATFTGGGSSFSTSGAAPDKNSYNVGLGLALISKGDWSLIANYDLETKDQFYSHSGSMTVKFGF